MAYMNSDQIGTTFIASATERGKVTYDNNNGHGTVVEYSNSGWFWITAKQAAWLFGQAARDGNKHVVHGTPVVDGLILNGNKDVGTFHASLTKTGAAALKFVYYERD